MSGSQDGCLGGVGSVLPMETGGWRVQMWRRENRCWRCLATAAHDAAWHVGSCICIDQKQVHALAAFCDAKSPRSRGLCSHGVTKYVSLHAPPGLFAHVGTRDIHPVSGPGSDKTAGHPPRTLMSAKSSPSWRPRLVFVILNVVPVHVCSKTRRKKKKRIKKKIIIQW